MCAIPPTDSRYEWYTLTRSDWRDEESSSRQLDLLIGLERRRKKEEEGS